MKVLNKTDVPQSIKIITADGRQDTIQLNRGKPVDLPAGCQIDPTMIAQYKAILKTDPPLVEPTHSAEQIADDANE
jgi:hypothetical protein